MVLRRRLHLPKGALDEQQVIPQSSISKAICGTPKPRATHGASDRGRSRGRAKIAFTLSDTFCVDRHRRFQPVARRRPDRHPCQPGGGRGAGRHCPSRKRGRRRSPKVETLVVTRSEDGALAMRNGAREMSPPSRLGLVDTTGAETSSLQDPPVPHAAGASKSRRAGAICAAEVIQHYGARPGRTSGRSR